MIKYVVRRSRKIKCIIPRAGAKCERCAARSIPCSNVYIPTHPGGGLRPQDHHKDFARMRQGHDLPEVETTLFDRLSLALNSIYAIQGESVEGSRCGYDIGTGTPSDILREGELSKEILKLYFANFSDVHFFFDEDRFLLEFDLGEVQQVVLFSMMALGIKYDFRYVKDRICIDLLNNMGTTDIRMPRSSAE
jgi:hypothetical protein